MPKLGRIYYIIPDIFRLQLSPVQMLRQLASGQLGAYLKKRWKAQHRPIGGIKMHYLHCLMLRKAGYDAMPLVMGKRDGNFFGYDVPMRFQHELGQQLEPNDVVISTEFHPYDGLVFQNATRVIFVQNWGNLERRLAPQDRGKSYLDLGYDHVIVCGDYMRDYIRKHMGIESFAVTNGIDHSVFFADSTKRQPGRVIGMPRKHPDQLEEIVRLVRKELPGLDYVPIDGLAERELAEEYRKADIYLATGYPEGFGLPVLEAMRSGATVVGYSGQGALEFMEHERSALIAEDGDTRQAAKHLLRVLRDSELKERLRAEGERVAAKYSFENMEARLFEFYGRLESELST